MVLLPFYFWEENLVSCWFENLDKMFWARLNDKDLLNSSYLGRIQEISSKKKVEFFYCSWKVLLPGEVGFFYYSQKVLLPEIKSGWWKLFEQLR